MSRLYRIRRMYKNLVPTYTKPVDRSTAANKQNRRSSIQLTFVLYPVTGQGYGFPMISELLRTSILLATTPERLDAQRRRQPLRRRTDLE